MSRLGSTLSSLLPSIPTESVCVWACVYVCVAGVVCVCVWRGWCVCVCVCVGMGVGTLCNRKFQPIIYNSIIHGLASRGLIITHVWCSV